jgi:hypothetical protein
VELHRLKQWVRGTYRSTTEGIVRHRRQKREAIGKGKRDREEITDGTVCYLYYCAVVVDREDPGVENEWSGAGQKIDRAGTHATAGCCWLPAYYVQRTAVLATNFVATDCICIYICLKMSQIFFGTLVTSFRPGI